MGKRINAELKKQILDDIANNLDNKDIANKHGLTIRTIQKLRKTNNETDDAKSVDSQHSEKQVENVENVERPVVKDDSDEEDDKSIDDAYSALYAPENIATYIQTESAPEQKHNKIPRSLINEANKDLKEKNKKALAKRGKKGKDFDEDEELDLEQIDKDKKRLITQIRQYIFTFTENKNINDYIGNNRNRYMLTLVNKSVKDLTNILEYIRFLVRHHSGTDKLITTSITAVILLIEKIGGFAGLRLDGLTTDISSELNSPTSDLNRAIIELSIEMETSKYTNSPKIDIALMLSQKMLSTHAMNKLKDKMQGPQIANVPAPPPPKAVDTYLKAGLDEGLKDKYNDL